MFNPFGGCARFRCFPWVFISVVLLAKMPAYCQTGQATVTGTVSDNTGASIVGAHIIASNLATKVQREVFSESGGVYIIPNLPSGHTL